MIALPLYLSLVLAPRIFQEPLVTFESKAARVELLFPALSKATGVPLTFSPQTKDEVLIVSVHEVPLNVLREKLASATSAEWQKEGQGFRLVRTPKLRQALEHESVRRAQQDVISAQDAIRKSLAQAGEYSETFARATAERLLGFLLESDSTEKDPNIRRRIESLRPNLPAYRLLSRIALLLDPAAIAAIPADTKAVYSTQPNRLQKPFPKGVNEALTSYRREVELLSAHLPDEPTLPRNGMDSNLWQAVSLRQRRAAVPAKILVNVPAIIVNRSSYLQLMVADDQGKIIERAYLNLPANPSFTPVPPAPPIPPPQSEAPIVFSALAKEYSESLAKGFSQERGAPIPLSSALLEILLNPERHELTSLSLSEALFAVAKAKQVNLIVSPPYASTGPFPGRGIGPKAYFEEFVNSVRGRLSVQESDRWILGKPDDWYITQRSEPNRSAQGRFLRNAAKRPIGIEDLASLAVESPSQTGFVLARMVVRLLPGQSVDTYGASDFTLLQLHGSLTPQQRQAALGEGLPYGGFSPAQRTILDKIVYNEMGLQMEWEYRGEEGGYEGVHANIRFQPTECYANGIPSTALLQLRDDSKRVIRCIGKSIEGYTTMTEGDESRIAYLLMAKERPDLQLYRRDSEYSEFNVIDLTQYNYTLRTEPRLKHSGQIRSINSAGKSVDKLEKLPQDVWAKIQSELAKLREAYKNYRPPAF